MGDYSDEEILNAYARGLPDGRALERRDIVNWLSAQYRGRLQSSNYLAACIERGEHVEKGHE